MSKTTYIFASLIILALVTAPVMALCPCGEWGDWKLGHCGPHDDCCQQWFIFHHHGSRVCPPEPPMPATASTSYLPVFTGDIWNHRCVLDDLKGTGPMNLSSNGEYTITFIAPHGLEGASICAGVQGGDTNDWNIHADEQRLGGMAIAAFVVRTPQIGTLLHARPALGTGPITVTVQSRGITAPIFDQTFEQEVNLTFPSGA
jgi:hypothetical protein